MDELARVASKGPRWASLIFDLVVALEPTRVLEMGTAVGISGAYVAAALEANGFGALVTVEGNARNYEIACETFAALGLDHRVTVVKGKFGEVIDDVIDSEPRFDLVFKDGDHSEAATVEWFDSLAPRLAPTSSFLLDDIRRDAGMKSAWNQVKRRGRVAASVDFFGMGLVLLKPPPHAESRHYRYGIR